MASTSNQGPNPNRGRKRRRPSTAAVVAGTVGKVLGTFLLICVITGGYPALLCFSEPGSAAYGSSLWYTVEVRQQTLYNISIYYPNTDTVIDPVKKCVHF